MAQKYRKLRAGNYRNGWNNNIWQQQHTAVM